MRFLVLFLTLLAAPLARAEHEVGNPGDPIRLLVNAARDDARVIIVRVDPSALATTDTNVSSWYQQNRDALENALQNATPIWIDDVWPYCAKALASDLTITFSYPTCHDSVHTSADAIKLLLHEGTHLVGNQDENLADGVANAVYSTWLNSDAMTTPRWDVLNPGQTPLERAAHASVLFEDAQGHHRLFAWGGCNESDDVALECSSFLGDGGIYDVENKVWEAVPEPPQAWGLEGRRAYSTAVFTGLTGVAANKILVFGGCSGADHTCRDDYNSILSYDLATHSWSLIPGSPLEGRSRHSALWTGNAMLIYGGIADQADGGRGRSLGDGALYEPVGNNWTLMDAHGAPSDRRFASAVLTGVPGAQTLIVYGGCDRQSGRYCVHYLKDGGIYDLQNGHWGTPIDSGSISARALHSAVWTGKEMIVFGGLYHTNSLSDAATFNPATGEWKAVSGLVSEGRYGHEAVWTGDRMLVFGGVSGLNDYAPGIREFYLPTPTTPFGRWSEPVVPAAPVGRWLTAAAWTGHELMVWGGMSEDRHYLNSGGAYVPKMAP